MTTVMEKLTLTDLMNIYEYEKVRNAVREEMIAYKKIRRVQLGPYISLTFEDRKTVRFQVQEMMRAERMVADDVIQRELDVYNTLLPNAGELSATLFIEITDPDQIRPILNRFIGLTKGETVWLDLDGIRVAARFETGRETDDQISSVHYVRFPFTPAAREAFGDQARPAVLTIEYQDYRYATPLPPETRAALWQDLTS
jgi:hypothetical protein